MRRFKGPTTGIGAHMPNFVPYAIKLPFLYLTKLVGHEYEGKKDEKILKHFLEKKKHILWPLELQSQFLGLKSALTTIFLVKMSQNCTFCIQLSILDIIMCEFLLNSPPTPFWRRKEIYFSTQKLCCQINGLWWQLPTIFQQIGWNLGIFSYE